MEEEVSIGQITVSKNLPRETVLEHLTPLNKAFIKDDIWDLGKLKYVSHDCMQLLKIAKTCKVKELHLCK